MGAQHQKSFLGQCHRQHPRSWDTLADFPCAVHNRLCGRLSSVGLQNCVVTLLPGFLSAP